MWVQFHILIARNTKMKLRNLYIIFLSLLLSTQLQAQLSPGDLTTSHADLEGLANCTQCHTLGDKVSNDKCLACHTEIKELVDNRLGYHSSRDVRGKDCALCHSEHHGRNFDMVRFDEENFNHDLTGYELTGAHQKIDCRDCHMPDFIADRDLKKRKNTFLGLNQDCVACHEDVHQGTLYLDCVNCHSTDAFAPATYFNHDHTDYPLVGKHQEVDCIDCHRIETRKGKEFQVFTGIEFANCNSCHEDVHDNNLGTNCKQCHSETSFTSMSRIRRFDHNTTDFPLRGAHQRVDCRECHNMDVAPANVFQDQIGISPDDCVSCHEDVHEGKFGINCMECHNEDAWVGVSTTGFDHSLTDFDLLGKHATVDCRECHTADLTEPVAHGQCIDCHTDYHEGEFVSNGVVQDCAACHTEDGFDIVLYTLEQHNESVFPLEGGHLATPCFACHLQEDKWRFRNIGERCVDCHEDVHEGYIAEEYYPNQDCEKCHTVDTWFDNLFDHNLTDFELLGVHAETDCMACHAVADESQQNKYAGFLEISADCASCHENVHDDQFEINGITDCARCHGFNSWDVSDFNHDNTAFKLEGRHAEVACDACHKSTLVDGKMVTQYKFESFECIVCHQ